MADDITMQRLDQRIEWYDRHAAYNQRAYKVLKLIVIVAAGVDPFSIWHRGFQAAVACGRARCCHRSCRRHSAAESTPRQLDQLPLDLRGAQIREVSISRQGRPLRRSDRSPRAVGRACRVAHVPGDRQMGNAAGKAGQEAVRLQLCPQRWLMLRRLCVRHPQRLSMRGKEDLPDPKLRYKSIRTSS